MGTEGSEESVGLLVQVPLGPSGEELLRLPFISLAPHVVAWVLGLSPVLLPEDSDRCHTEWPGGQGGEWHLPQ